MCREERPLSTVRFLGDALSLNPTTNPPTPDANQTDNGRTPEEITVFHNIYLPILTRNGIPITEHDSQELELRGLPPVPEETLRWARQYQARQDYERSLGMQPAPMQVRWVLDEADRVEEPEEYISDPGPPTEDPPELTSDDSTSESDLPVTPFEFWDSPIGRDIGHSLALNLLLAAPGFDSENLNQLFGLGDTVQRVSSDDERFRDEGYQSLRSSSSESEREEGEILEGDEDIEEEME